MKLVNLKKKKIIAVALGIWGIILLGSGSTMLMMKKPASVSKPSLTIIQKRVAEKKSNIIKLKDMTQEINNPLSVDVKDYLDDVDDIDTKVLAELKLDTSNVNPNQAGSYNYTITYNKKKYSGTYVIKEKELPKIENLPLKDITITKGDTISTDVNNYINGTIDSTIIANCKLDTSGVNTAESGTYQYTVTYNNHIYTGKIIVNEPPAPVTDKIEMSCKLNSSILTSCSISINGILSTNGKDYISFYDLSPALQSTVAIGDKITATCKDQTSDLCKSHPTITTTIK